MMMALKPDPENGFQKVLISTKFNDLTKADFVQLYINWTGSESLKIDNALVDAQMGDKAWWDKKAAEDPNFKDSDAGKFWRNHIIIQGNIGQNLVGDQVAGVQILKDGKWVDMEENMIPGKYSGLIRFKMPDSAKRTNRNGLGIIFASSSDKLSGDLHIDDIMVGMTGIDAANGYNIKMTDYAKEAGIVVSDPGKTTTTGQASVSPIVFALMAILVAFVIMSVKTRKAI